jgi:hypothetical protein
MMMSQSDKEVSKGRRCWGCPTKDSGIPITMRADVIGCG